MIELCIEGSHRSGKNTLISGLVEDLGLYKTQVLRGEGNRQDSPIPSELIGRWAEIEGQFPYARGERLYDLWMDAGFLMALGRQLLTVSNPDYLLMNRGILSRAQLAHKIGRCTMQTSVDELYTSRTSITAGLSLDTSIVVPDLVVFLDAPVGVLLSRLDLDDPKFEFRRDNIISGVEHYDFAQRYVSGFVDRVVTLDATRPPEEIKREVLEVLM